MGAALLLALLLGSDYEAGDVRTRPGYVHP